MKLRAAAALRLTLVLLFVAPALGAADKPSLVVVISVDQMRADYLDRFRPWFGEDGFNRFLQKGARFTQARQRHATTFTGPGHASIGTGLDPRDHGIIGNLWYDKRGGESIYCVEDRAVKWIGAPDGAPQIPIAPASPVNLDATSLGDRLKERFPGARVIGLALKDRAAVLMAGRKADAALWFEERFERFVTSSYYPPLPALLSFNDGLPAFFAAPEHRTWPLSGRIPAADLDRLASAMDGIRDVTAQPEGYRAAFPHALGNPKAIVSSPWGDVLVLQLARFTIESQRLGSRADRPDLLFVGLSSTDYYGHWFGPDSKEIADGLVRLDASLAAFFRWLDDRVGRDRVMTFLTADHGVQSLPEVTRAKKKKETGETDYLAAGRIDFTNSRDGSPTPRLRDVGGDRFALETFLGNKFGYEPDPDARVKTDGAVLSFEEPGFTVNRAAVHRRGLDVEEVKRAIRDWLRKRPGILTAWTDTEIADGLPPDAPYELAVERAFRPDRSADVIVLLKPGWMWSYGKESGTTHGQPNDDDARVPLAVWGPGVAAGSYDTPTSPLAIARTVAALYGFEAGEPDVAPLQPVLGAVSPAAPR